MIKPKIGCKLILLIVFLLSFQFAKAQRETIEAILVQEIQSQKNLFITRSPVFLDQRLDMTLTAKVNKLINVRVNGIGLYDDDFSGKIQSSQSLALGFVFTMPR